MEEKQYPICEYPPVRESRRSKLASLLKGAGVDSRTTMNILFRMQECEQWEKMISWLEENQERDPIEICERARALSVSYTKYADETSFERKAQVWSEMTPEQQMAVLEEQLKTDKLVTARRHAAESRRREAERRERAKREEEAAKQWAKQKEDMEKRKAELQAKLRRMPPKERKEYLRRMAEEFEQAMEKIREETGGLIIEPYVPEDLQHELSQEFYETWSEMTVEEKEDNLPWMILLNSWVAYYCPRVRNKAVTVDLRRIWYLMDETTRQANLIHINLKNLEAEIPFYNPIYDDWSYD